MVHEAFIMAHRIAYTFSSKKRMLLSTGCWLLVAPCSRPSTGVIGRVSHGPFMFLVNLTPILQGPSKSVANNPRQSSLVWHDAEG